MNIKKTSYLAVLLGFCWGIAHADIKDIHFGLRTFNTAIQSFCEDNGNKITSEFTDNILYSPNKYNFILPGYQLANSIYNAYSTPTNVTSLCFKSALPTTNLVLALAGKYGTPEMLDYIYSKIQFWTPFLSIASMFFDSRNTKNKNHSWFSSSASLISPFLFGYFLKKPNKNALDEVNPALTAQFINYGAYLAHAAIYQYFFRNRENSNLKQTIVNLGLGYAAHIAMNMYIFPGIHNWNSTPEQKAAFYIKNQFENKLLLKNYDNINTDAFFNDQLKKYINQVADLQKQEFNNNILTSKVMENQTLQQYLKAQQTHKNAAAGAYLTYLLNHRPA